MDFLHQIKVSLFYFLKSFGFLEKHNLLKLLILPSIISILVTIFTVVVAIKTSGALVELLLPYLDLSTLNLEVQTLIRGVIMVSVRAYIFFIFLKIYRYLIMIFLVPVFCSISEKIQSIECEDKPPLNTRKYLSNCTKSSLLTLACFLLEAILSTLIVILGFVIAWIIPLVPLFILGIESFFVGLLFANYRNQQFQFGKGERRYVINHYPGLIIGNGLFFNILILIPIIGVLLAPTMAMVSSSLSINHLEKRRKILCSSAHSTPTMASS